MPQSTSLISCPKCGHEFNVEDVLSSKIEEKYKRQWQQKFAEVQSQFDGREKTLSQKETELVRRAADVEGQVKERLAGERQSLMQSAVQKAREDFEVQMKSLVEENESRKRQLHELRRAQIENEQLKRKMEDLEQDFELKYQQKMRETLKDETERVRKRESDLVALKVLEKDKQLDDLRAQINQMKQKAEQGSMQLQGEVQELALEEMLRSFFPLDTIQEVGKGVRGADTVHTVRNHAGAECGKIVYESKRTKSFSEEWIQKLKADALLVKADCMILVSQAMPEGIEKVGRKDGVWICEFQDVRSVATLLRESLIQIHSLTSSQSNKGEKMQMLYDYLTGNEFRLQLEAIVDGFRSLQDGYNDEKLKMQKIWKEREKQLEKVLLNTVNFYGSIKGIAGRSVPDISMLEEGSRQRLP
jgi:hypothetical protein